MKRLIAATIAMAVWCMILAAPVNAQTTTAGLAAVATPAPVTFNDFYAAGLSGSPYAVPKIAGNAWWAHRLDANTFSFTIFEALPTGYKPFSVVTNVGTGIAQKLFNVGTVDIYGTGAGGIQWKQANVGYVVNTGFVAAIHVKGHWYLYPHARYNKGSVSDPQAVIGMDVGYGR